MELIERRQRWLQVVGHQESDDDSQDDGASHEWVPSAFLTSCTAVISLTYPFKSWGRFPVGFRHCQSEASKSCTTYTANACCCTNHESSSWKCRSNTHRRHCFFKDGSRLPHSGGGPCFLFFRSSVMHSSHTVTHTHTHTHTRCIQSRSRSYSDSQASKPVGSPSSRNNQPKKSNGPPPQPSPAQRFGETDDIFLLLVWYVDLHLCSHESIITCSCVEWCLYTY